jgi:cytochrome c oxidase subunit II
VPQRPFASNARKVGSAESNSGRGAISTEDGLVRYNVRITILIAIAAVLVFATPAYMRDSSRSTQEEQTKQAKTKPPAEAPPRVIAMTAKDFEFDPAEIHLKVGEKVRLQIISSDRTHGIHISAFPDGAKANTPPGLAFIFGEDCWKLNKGVTVPVDIEATEPGTYSFLCCKSCGTDHKRMTGRIYVEP